jgi:hypothetical protein
MTTLHTGDHEELLRAALAEGLAPDDARLKLRALLKLRDLDCAQCSSDFEGLLRTRDEVAAALADERATLAALERRSATRATASVGDFLRERFAELPRPGPLVGAGPAPGASPPGRTEAAQRRVRLTRMSLLVAGAAAAVVCVGWLLRFLRADPANSRRAPLLGETSDAELSPRGPVAEYAPIRWNLTLHAGERFHLIVWGEGAQARGEPLLDILCDENRWFGDTRTWPSKIRWQVQVVDASGAESPPLRASASR